MTVPQTVMLSYYQGLGDKLARWRTSAGRIGRPSERSRCKSPTPTIRSPSPLSIGYQNTWHGALGGQLQLSDAWQLDLGVAYDSTMTTRRTAACRSPSATTGASVPAVGLDPHWTLSLAYEFLWGGSPTVDVNRGPLAGHVSGRYADTWLQFIALGVTWNPRRTG